MTYLHIVQSASIEVLNHKSLLEAWKQHGGPGSLVGSFTVQKAAHTGTAPRFAR